MAKDPAFLFYPGDYISGTMYLDFECKGAYMDLLMLQFQKDHMTIHMIKQVLGHKFDHIWSLINDKFQEKDGKYWNERLRVEKENRVNFCKSRKKNREATSHMNKHMTLHMEDEDVNTNKSKERVVGEGKGIETVSPQLVRQNAEDMVVKEMMKIWQESKPGYCATKEVDYPALLEIAYAIAYRKGWKQASVVSDNEYGVLESWKKIVNFIVAGEDKFFKKLTIDGIANPKNFQKIEESMRISIPKVKEFDYEKFQDQQTLKNLGLK